MTTLEATLVPLPTFNENTQEHKKSQQFDQEILSLAYPQIGKWKSRSDWISDEERRLLAFSQCAYGEVEPDSIRKMIDFANLNQNDVFCDLGCGLGKVAIQVALESPVKKVIGIELAKQRYEIAKNAVSLLEKAGKLEKGRVTILHGDLTNFELWKEGTVLYSASTVYPELMIDVARAAHKLQGFRVLICDVCMLTSTGLEEMTKFLTIGSRCLRLKADWDLPKSVWCTFTKK